MIRRWLPVAVAATTMAVTAAACTSGAKPNEAPAPGAALTMANGNDNVAIWPAVSRFVDRYRELSPGAPVTVVDRWGDFKPGSEEQIVRDVAAGKADVGWVGTRVFDLLGVPAFQALNAPMLVDSYALQQAIVDSDVSGTMLGSLNKVGVRGIGLLAGGLRKPVSVKHPYLRPADWQGTHFGARRSAVQKQAIEALGATTTEALGDDRDQLLDSGQLGAFENSLRVYQFNSLEKRAPYVAANVNLWPEMVVLIVNPGRFDKLPDQVRTKLMQAAHEVSAQSAQLAGGDATVLAQECQLGARAGVATAADLDALRKAFAPVYTKLRADPTTNTLIGRIEQLKAATKAEPALSVPAGCAPGSSAGAPAPPGTANPLLGRWVAASPHPYLFDVTDALWVQYERQADGSIQPGWRGTYTLHGSTILLKEIGAGCDLEYQMTLQGGELRIKVIKDEPESNPDCGAQDLGIQRFIYETAPFHKNA
jgi:TRAP-type C4-dicarboxylate transport system substrate-binding protein